MPVQAHVQADGGACLPGSGLDKITHLVDAPEAVAATWQMSSPRVCQTCSVPPPSVWRTVLAASSLTASTKSGVRDGVSPADAALLAMKLRTGHRSSE